MKLYIIYPIIVFIIFSCSSCKDGNVSHPTRINLLDETKVNFSWINSDLAPSELDFFTSGLLEIIENPTRVFLIGEEVESPDQLLGEIVDGIILNDKYYLLDGQRKQVVVYDQQGKFLYTFAGEGRGPGELVNPTRIIPLNDEIFVLDDHFSVKKFSVNPDNGLYENTGNLSNDVRPDDICPYENSIVVNTLPIDGPGSSEGKENILQFELMDFTNQVVGFSNFYISDSWFAKMHLSMGGINCSPKRSEIVHYFRSLGQFYGFNPDGELIWTSRIKDFDTLILLELNGSLGPDPDNAHAPFDAVENIVEVDRDTDLIQVVNRTLVENRYQTYLKSYFLNTKNGGGSFIGTNLPLILDVDLESRTVLSLGDDLENQSIVRISKHE